MVTPPVFLTAEWRKLIMLNYQVDPEILLPYLPAGTQLDFWQGKCFVSIVGFRFLQTAIKGIKFPFHTNFEEINLRFYVTFNENGVKKRGVVFVSEIVPKPAIVFIANNLYGEKYSSRRMSYNWKSESNLFTADYRFKEKNRWNSFSVQADLSQPFRAQQGSLEEFITEHYWGYANRNTTKTVEYAVEHPSWDLYPIVNQCIDIDFETAYGSAFAHLTHKQPDNALIAEGSEVLIRNGVKHLFL